MDKRDEEVNKTDEIFCKLLDLSSRLQEIESVKPVRAKLKAEMHTIKERRASVMDLVGSFSARKEEPKLRRAATEMALKKCVIEEQVPDVTEKIQLFSQSDWSKINEKMENEEKEKRKEEKRKRSLMP